MSNDLISRDEVIKAVDRHTKEDGTLDDDISVILEEVKMAFNKGKVIEELRKNSRIFSDSGNYNGAACFDKAIEIVERGGVG